eukprot:6214835-Pleurochrysis_carterae.AAC.6
MIFAEEGDRLGGAGAWNGVRNLRRELAARRGACCAREHALRRARALRARCSSRKQRRKGYEGQLYGGGWRRAGTSKRWWWWWWGRRMGPGRRFADGGGGVATRTKERKHAAKMALVVAAMA